MVLNVSASFVREQGNFVCNSSFFQEVPMVFNDRTDLVADGAKGSDTYYSFGAICFGTLRE